MSGGSVEYQEFMRGAAALLGSFAILLVIVSPLIRRHRRKRDGARLHEVIERAKADILEDGIVELPTGPRARPVRWSVGRTGETKTSGAPVQNAFHGGPWPT